MLLLWQGGGAGNTIGIKGWGWRQCYWYYERVGVQATLLLWHGGAWGGWCRYDKKRKVLLV